MQRFGSIERMFGCNARDHKKPTAIRLECQVTGLVQKKIKKSRHDKDAANSCGLKVAELALMLVRLDHIAYVIVDANYSIM